MNKNVKKWVIGTWLIRSYKLQFEEYLKIKKQRDTYAHEVDMEYNLSNLVFVEWFTSKFYNHLDMDWYTKNALWIYWIRDDDEVVLSNKEDSNLKDENNNDKHEITKVFRIKTNLFDYETPLCVKFSEFNYLFKVDPKLLTHDIRRTETYEDYENKLNNEVDEPWSEDGVPYEICDHICEPFHIKDGKTKWSTCNLNEDGFYIGRELSGMVRVGYLTYFQNHEWYNDLMDNNFKEEALKQKSIYEKSWGDASQINDHECSPFANWRDNIRGPYANFITTCDPYLDVNRIFGRNGKASNNSDVQDKEDQHNKRRCDTAHDKPVCKIRRFEMIKYSFGKDEKYVAIKECEYYDLIRTNEDTCHAYQEISRSMDEGWVVTKDEGNDSVIIMANVIPPDHVDDLPIVEPNQPDVVPVIPEPVLVDEDEDPKDEEFEEEEEPQKEEDMDIDDEDDEE
ncbi:hypothetical protein Tco_0465247 [Tanacetum coccineum]